MILRSVDNIYFFADSKQVKTLNTRKQDAPKTYILNFTSFLGSDLVTKLKSEFSEKEFK